MRVSTGTPTGQSFDLRDLRRRNARSYSVAEVVLALAGFLPTTYWLSTIYTGNPTPTEVAHNWIAGWIFIPLDAFLVGIIVAMNVIGRLFPDRLTLDGMGLKTWRDGRVKVSVEWARPGAEFYLDDHTGDPSWSSRHEFEKHLLRFTPAGMAIPIPLEAEAAIWQAAREHGLAIRGPGALGTPDAGRTHFSGPETAVRSG